MMLTEQGMLGCEGLSSTGLCVELMEISYLDVSVFTGTLQGEKRQVCKCTRNFGTCLELCFFSIGHRSKQST